MCVEFCWCLCIHKVSFRGACYFFASVHSYEGVSRLLHLIFTNVLLRTYFMDGRKTDLDMSSDGENAVELLSKSLYYLATTVTAFLIFRAVEKEWRHLLQWSAILFGSIEVAALCMYFVLHPNSYSSATCVLALASRTVFSFFYLVSIALYALQLSREEDGESEWRFEESEWEPRFLGKNSPRNLNLSTNLNSNFPPGSGISGISGISGFSGFSGFGTLGFGENTIKWLEAEKVLPPPQLILPPLTSYPLSYQSTIEGRGKGGKNLKISNNPNNDQDKEKDKEGKFEVRYEVCKSNGKGIS